MGRCAIYMDSESKREAGGRNKNLKDSCYICFCDCDI